ncbi:hypothetical protein Tco_0194613 [Tanacetum coccineum]
MEQGFLSQKGSKVGIGVKEKNLNRNKKNTSSGIGVSTDSDNTMNDDTPVGVASGVIPSVVDMMVEMGKQNSLDDTTVPESFPPLSTPFTTTAGNASGKSSYANIIGKPSEKKVNVRTLFTPGGNRIDVVVPMDSICAISERFANTAYGFFLGKKVAYPVVANYVLSAIATKLGTPLMLNSYTYDMCMQSWGRSSYVRVMIELRADVELKDNIIVDMSKITGEGHYICNICVEYEWKPPRCASCMVLDIFIRNVRRIQKDYRPVPKKPTANSGGNKKKGVEPTIELSNSNPFEVLNSVDNDEDTGTTSVIDRIWKFEELLTSGQDILVDEAGNSLKKVEFLGDYDSEDGVASVDNDMARSMASERVGFGTQSLLEQWRNSYGNSDYDDDPYDDDM